MAPTSASPDGSNKSSACSSRGLPDEVDGGPGSGWVRRVVLWVALLLAVLALDGCARALAPMLVSPHAPSCAPDGEDCLTQGREAFDDYRRHKVDEIERRSRGYRLPSAPVAFVHPARTEYAILLIHGLNDSAYYMADLGGSLQQNGFNVVTVLLPGHGTDTRDMVEATAEQWRAEVDTGLDMAALMGRKVIVGGFSLGAALAIDAVLRHSDLHGLLLFSPAIRLRSFDGIASLTCAPGLRTYERETELPENPVKYKYRMGNSVCQLTRLLQHNLAAGNTTEYRTATASEKVRELARHVKVPTFVALSYADQRISPDAALEFARNVSAPVLVVTFGTAMSGSAPPRSGTEKIWSATDASLPHSYLVRRSNPYNGQENPCFDRLAKVLTGFLSDQFHTGGGSSDSSYPDCGPFGDVMKGAD